MDDNVNLENDNFGDTPSMLIKGESLKTYIAKPREIREMSDGIKVSHPCLQLPQTRRVIGLNP